MARHQHKRPFRVLRKLSQDGVAHLECEADFWHGPCCSDGSCTVGCDEVGYETVRFTANNTPTTCSYGGELRKAFGG